MTWRFILIFFLVFHGTVRAEDSTLRLKKVIRGGLSPKSVVHSGAGLFFAQNMMYRHTVNVYDRNYALVKSISDKIVPKDFGIDTIKGSLTGAPVEVAFSHQGKYAWVSNYNMSGDKFSNPGCDACHSDTFDLSFLYKINTESLEIEAIIPVGSVPKYVAVSPDDKYVLVSNWSGGDVSIVDIEKGKEIKRVHAGRYPRGIVVDSKSEFAYVTVMGSVHVLKINLRDFSTSLIKNVGSGPRHLCITSDDSALYVSLNNEGKIAKINLMDNSITKTVCAGSPRSMVISPDDKFLYVVNYTLNKMSKVDLNSFKVTEQHETKEHPIGITFDADYNEVWVACYSGSLMVYRDTYYKNGSYWYDYFNVGEQLTNVFDYVGKIGESFFASAEIKSSVTATVPKKEKLKTEKPVVENKSLAEKKKLPVEKEKSKKEEPASVATAKSVSKKASASDTQSETLDYPSGSVFVIVGSFKIESNASKLSASLKAKGYKATTLKNKNGMTYTAVGSFTNEESAKDTLQKIKSTEGIDAWIYKL